MQKNLSQSSTEANMRLVNVYMHQCHRVVSPLFRVSHPSQVVLPFPRWEPKEKPVKEDDVGPQVTHIYEVNAEVCSDTTRWRGRRLGRFVFVAARHKVCFCADCLDEESRKIGVESCKLGYSKRGAL